MKKRHPAHKVRETRSDRIFQAVVVTIGILLMLVVAYPLYFTVIASFSKP